MKKRQQPSPMDIEAATLSRSVIEMIGSNQSTIGTWEITPFRQLHGPVYLEKFFAGDSNNARLVLTKNASTDSLLFSFFSVDPEQKNKALARVVLNTQAITNSRGTPILVQEGSLVPNKQGVYKVLIALMREIVESQSKE